MDLDLAPGIFLLELLVTHLNEHVVIDFVWSTALKFSGDSRIQIVLLRVLFLRGLLVLLLVVVHNVSEICSIFRCFIGLFLFLGCVTRWVETL